TVRDAVLTEVAGAHVRGDHFKVAALGSTAFTETLRYKLASTLWCTQMSPFKLGHSVPGSDRISLPSGLGILWSGSAKVKQARLHSRVNVHLKRVVVGPRKMKSSGHVQNIARTV